MQFFPAALSHDAQLSRPGGLFDLADAKPGQDFADLFSTHMNEPGHTDTPPPAEAPRAYSSQDRTYADDAPPARDGVDHAPARPPAQDAAPSSDRTAVAGRREEKTGSGAPEAAKDAAPRDDGPRSEKGEASSKAASGDKSAAAERAAAKAGDAEQAAVEADESLLAEVRELLGALSADAAQRRGKPGVEAVSSKIETLHELLRQFRDAPPASRSELAVALGEQLKGLRKDLAAMVKAERAGEGQGKAESASRGVSLAGQKIDALLHRLEARAVAGREPAARTDRGAAAASASAGTASAGTAAAVEGRTGGARPSAAAVTTRAAAQGADDISARTSAAGPQSGAADTPGSGRGSEVAARPRPREGQAFRAPEGPAEPRTQGPGAVAAKISPTPAGAEESAPSPERPDKAAAAEGQAHRAAAKGQDGPTRPESVVTNSSLAAAAGRPAPARDAAAQNPHQGEAQRQDGPVGASEKARMAESGSAKNQPDARQGFFGEPDRDKGGSRAAQTAGAGKNVPESLTQASTQSAQTPFQQRLESPVGARNAQVYQQVENGAFRNLGQGVKQLVIRLDPVDLGQISVILQVRGKEVQAVLRASNQDTSVVLSEQLAQLRTQLEAQGLKVGKLEVQTQLADSQTQSQWQGAESHNRYQENQELAMSARRWRNMERVAPGLVRDVQNTPHRENLSQNGLDIFA